MLSSHPETVEEFVVVLPDTTNRGGSEVRDKSVMANERKRIGIIADSHGNLEATAEAIRLLKGRGAGILIHLGDFCDSIRHDLAAAIIDLLLEHDVLVVKGNNDFLVEKMLADERRPAAAE